MFEYYGGKGNLVRWGYYPRPAYSIIVEPFAGAARYALHHHENREVILIDKNPSVIRVWKWLQSVSEEDFLSLPFVEPKQMIPDMKPLGAREFLGFVLNQGSPSPKNYAGSFTERIKKLGWKRYLKNLYKIRNWDVGEGDYFDAPDIEATWFIDPPYSQQSLYPYNDIDYGRLADWCRTRKGQVIVCENSDATWLPFQPLCHLRATQRKDSKLRHEGIWVNENPIIRAARE